MSDTFDPGRAPGRAGRTPGIAALPPIAPGAASDADLPPGPGQRLRQARLHRGLELRQVARELRLTVERVQAIEEDDYAALPDPVFVVGYLKNYARLMDLNPEALVAAYRTRQDRSPVAPKPRSATFLARVKSSQEVGGAKPAATPRPSPDGRPRGLGRFGWGAPSTEPPRPRTSGQRLPGPGNSGTGIASPYTPSLESSSLASSPPGTVPDQERQWPEGRPEGQTMAREWADDRARGKDEARTRDKGFTKDKDRSRKKDPTEDQDRIRDNNSTKDKDRTLGMDRTRLQDFAWVALAAALFVLLLVLAWWTQRPAATPDSLAGGQEPVAEHLTQPRSPGAEEPSRDLPVAKRSVVAPGGEALTPSPSAGSPDEIDAGIQAEIEAEAGGEPDAEAELVPEPVEEEAANAGGFTPANSATPRVPGADGPVTTTSTSPPEADVAQVEDRLEVVIRFTGPTSVDIRDSTMNYALVGEMDKGDQYLLGGKPPYSLILGNAAAVEILVGGKPFDFQSVVRGNVARFILNPAPASTSAPATPAIPNSDPRHPRP